MYTYAAESVGEYGILLPVRMYNILKRAGLRNISDILKCNCVDFLHMPNFGVTSMNTLINIMWNAGYKDWVSTRKAELERYNIHQVQRKHKTTAIKVSAKRMPREMELQLYDAAVNTEQSYGFLHGVAWLWEKTGGSCEGFLNGAFEAYGGSDGTHKLRAFAKKYF